MTNQADYSKLKTPEAKSDLHKEFERLHRLDICYRNVVVPYKGNDTWIGLKGKRLHGEE
jgi:hypothetical protein